MCLGGVAGGGGPVDRESEGGVVGQAGRGHQSFPGRALSRGSFSSCDSVNRQ